jgi:glycosyltransferase involved in cell wall biosynthesis
MEDPDPTRYPPRICCAQWCRWKRLNNGRLLRESMTLNMKTADAPTAAKILFAIPSMVLGGSERVMLKLLHHLDRRRFEPHVAVLERGGVWLENAPPHVQVHELGVWRARRAVLPLARLCWKLRPQAVLSTSAHLNAALIAARPLLPMDTRLLAREGKDLTSPHAACGRFRLMVYKHVYQAADLVICQSDYMRETLICQFGLTPTKVVRIYNPVDIDSITALAESEPNPLPDAGPNLVAVGRFSHEKGFDLLLRCTPLIRQALPTVLVTLVGDGPDLPVLKAAQRELHLESCVRFVGLQRNPYPFIKHADLLVLPSRSEALPNVVLEAIALGTSVVATNCTRALREISSCTRQMRVASDTTPAALAAEIICALANTPTRPNPEPQFEARFGVQAVTREYERVLWHSIRARSVKARQHAGVLA